MNNKINTELMVFENEEFGNIRTVEIDGKPYFVASDIAKALGYVKPQNAISAHCRGALKQGIGVQTGIKSDGTPVFQTIEMLIIPEGDMYRLIVHSKLPSAERFEKWVFDEVLPTLNKTGSYRTSKTEANAQGKQSSDIDAAREIFSFIDSVVNQGKKSDEGNSVANGMNIFEGHEVEIFELNGVVYFNPYHVGECLELSNEAVRKAMTRMNDKQVVKLKNSDVTNSNIRKLNNAGENFLTESGVYKLAFKSRKPSAERFTNWVTDDVLPTLYKTGSYDMPSKTSKETEAPKPQPQAETQAAQSHFTNGSVPDLLLWFTQLDPRTRQDTLNLLKTAPNSAVWSAFAPEKQPLQANSEGNYGENPVENPNFRSQAMSEARKVCEKLGYGTNYKRGLSAIYREMKHLGVDWGAVKTAYRNNGGKNLSPSCMEQISLLPEYQSIFFDASKRLA